MPDGDVRMEAREARLTPRGDNTKSLLESRIHRGVMRAHGWLSAGANRNPKCASSEMIDALAEDVIAFAGEIVQLRAKPEAETFADSIMRRLENGCPSFLSLGGNVKLECSEPDGHDDPHRSLLGGVDYTWQTGAESGR